MFPGGEPADSRTFTEHNRADRRGQRVQKTVNAFELRIAFDIFVKRPEEILLDIGVRHTEIHVDHVRRRTAGDRQHQAGFRTDVLDLDSAERRKFDLRIQLPELTEDFQLNLGVGVRRFRIGKLHDPQGDLQDLALRPRLRFCCCLFFIGGIKVWNGQQGYQYSNPRRQQCCEKDSAFHFLLPVPMKNIENHAPVLLPAATFPEAGLINFLRQE